MINTMKKLAGIIAVAGFMGSVWVSGADGDSVIKDFMKKYHKAPKGTDPVCKKVQTGAASKEELKGLIDGYKAISMAKPPQGDAASWKDKTSKLVTASMNLEKGGPDAVAKYKEAVNCKACHDVHKSADK